MTYITHNCIKRFPWPTFLKTVNNLLLILSFVIIEEVIAWFIAIIDSTGLKFQFVTKHHHWLFGQNRTSLNALLLTRIKIGEDKPNQCSKTITWCKYLFTLSFSIPTSSARTYACCVPDCTHIPGLKSVINIKSQYFPLILQHKTSPYIPLFEVVCLLTFMRHCVLCHAVVSNVPYATVRHKRIIKPLVSYCLLEGNSLLTENHSPMPFIYPVWYCLVFFWFHLFTFSKIHFPFISVAAVISCTCSFRTESMLRMRCRRKVLNQLLHVSWQEKKQRRIPSKRSEIKVVDDAHLYIMMYR